MAESAQIKKLSAKHEQIMLWLLENPNAKLVECSRHFGLTQSWLSTIIHSDAFQSRMQELQKDYFGQAVLTIKDRAEAMTHLALEKLTEKLDVMDNPEMLLEVAKEGSRMLGIGQNRGLAPGMVAVQNNTVYVANQEDLERARTLMRQAQTLEAGQTVEAEVVQEATPEAFDEVS